jgi:hypothetical protein
MNEEKIVQSKEYFIVYGILIDAAKHQGFATYQELSFATLIRRQPRGKNVRSGRL